jgi:hypothetical protein
VLKDDTVVSAGQALERAREAKVISARGKTKTGQKKTAKQNKSGASTEAKPVVLSGNSLVDKAKALKAKEKNLPHQVRGRMHAYANKQEEKDALKELRERDPRPSDTEVMQTVRDSFPSLFLSATAGVNRETSGKALASWASEEADEVICQLSELLIVSEDTVKL